MKNHKERLRIAIEEYWRKSLPPMKEREINISTEGDFIVDIIGPRRAGKTFLMFLTIQNLLKKMEKKQTIYINFESRKLLPLVPEYFNDLIEIIYEEDLLKNKVYIFLDEIQRMKEWEKYLRSIYDEFKGKIKIFISGSTSKLTKSKLSYLLSGRHTTTSLLPLSFREFLMFKDFKFGKVIIEEEKAKIEKYLKEYLEFGGFPEVVINENKEQYLDNLFLDIIRRDVAPKVKNVGILEEFAYFLCTNSAKLTSFSNLKRLFGARGIKISVPTIENYFYLLKDVFLFFDSLVFSYKIKDQLQHPKKIFCIDTGFVNYFGFKFSEDLGRMIENLVAVELVRRYKKPEIFYWKDYQQNEVDFVLKEGLNVKQLIQVTYASAKDEIEKREIKALVKASNELKCKDLLAITWDCEDEIKVKKKTVKLRPLWKWLLFELPNR
ncbi:MAG: ATP-binding protein [Candidatus Aenigmarchaeota archaeon]|nr:ATP-binding protein [Candidatus Aenigmarchaeota archaeon]